MAAKKRRKKQTEEAVEKVEVQEQKPVKAKKRVRPPRNLISAESKQLINFKAWFTNLIDRDRRFKEHHYDQIRLYMQGLGLGETDEAYKFERAIKGYFGD